MSETFTFTGTVRQLALDEFVTSAGGKTLASAGTVVIESEGGALVAFASREGYQATFGRDPLATSPEPTPEPEPAPAPPAPKKKAPAKAKK